MKKERIDKLLFSKGFVRSREKASAMVMAGVVFIDGKRIDKPGTKVSVSSNIEIKEDPCPYVGRGGLKLEAALSHFGISVFGKVALDCGSSTGGFVDCLLKRGAKRVYAVDVGYGLLDWKLRNDKRVCLLEGKNIRYLDKEDVKEKIDIATLDLSFISLSLVIPKVLEFLEDFGTIIALVKPQFELTRKEVPKGGVIKDEAKQKKAVEKIIEFGKNLGLSLMPGSPFLSPISGKKGNKEFFVGFIKKD